MTNKNNKTHSFSVELAKEIGLEESLILQHLCFWCEGNADNPYMQKNGFSWVFISRKRILETYPYLSERKVRRAIDNLKSNGYILINNFNLSKIDKTNWYALTEKGYSLFGDSNLENGNTLVNLTNGWSERPSIGQDVKAIQTIKENYINKTVKEEKEDTNVSSKDDENWRTSFAIYKSLVDEAKLRLINDRDYQAYIESYYPNADYAKSINKMVEGFWGIEDGWEHCKKKRKTKNINMYAAMKKNLDNRSRIVYNPISTFPSKKSYNPKNEESRPSVPLHPELTYVDNDGTLSDGTFMKNGYRYYFSNKQGESFSVPPGEEPKPEGDNWEYAYGTGWYENIE